jgi:hypothetical protein
MTKAFRAVSSFSTVGSDVEASSRYCTVIPAAVHATRAYADSAGVRSFARMGLSGMPRAQCRN